MHESVPWGTSSDEKSLVGASGRMGRILRSFILMVSIYFLLIVILYMRRQQCI